MILKSRLPLHANQKYLIRRDSFELYLRKIEVLTDSNLIINSVRILIVVVALLMGYAHKKDKQNHIPYTKQGLVIKHRIPSAFKPLK